MLDMFFKPLAWFFSQTEEPQPVVAQENDNKKRARSNESEEEGVEPKSKRKRTVKSKTIDLVEDSDTEADAQAQFTLELLCDKRRGLSFSCAASNVTHTQNLSKLREKYLSDRIIQAMDQDAVDRLRFMGKSIQPKDLWLSGVLIRKFAQKLEIFNPDFKFIDYKETVIPLLKELKSKENVKASKGLRIKSLEEENAERMNGIKRVAISANDGSHYYTILVDLTDIEHIKIYGSDSLDMLKQHAEYFSDISEYFAALYPESMITSATFKMPNQQNIYDCGVSFCALMEKHARGEFNRDMQEAFAQQASFNYGPYRQHIVDVLLMDDAELKESKDTSREIKTQTKATVRKGRTKK